MEPLELLARIDERQKNDSRKIDLIYAEVKKTNGRVTSLEKWRSALKGSWTTLVIVSVLAGTFIGWLINFLI